MCNMLHTTTPHIEMNLPVHSLHMKEILHEIITHTITSLTWEWTSLVSPHVRLILLRGRKGPHGLLDLIISDNYHFRRFIIHMNKIGYPNFKLWSLVFFFFFWWSLVLHNSTIHIMPQEFSKLVTDSFCIVIKCFN